MIYTSVLLRNGLQSLLVLEAFGLQYRFKVKQLQCCVNEMVYLPEVDLFIYLQSLNQGCFRKKTCNDVRNGGIWQLNHQREETSLVETYPWNRWDKNCILVIQSSQWKLWNGAFETPFRTCVTFVGVLLAAGGSSSIFRQHIRDLKKGRSFSCCLP